MIWLYISLGVVVGIPVLAMIVGSLLPERYEAQVVAILDARPEQVWPELVDYQKNPVSGRMRKQTTPLPDVDALPSWKEDLGQSVITVVCEAMERPRRLKRTMTDSVVPMTAEGEINVEATQNGCRIRTTQVTVIKSGTWHVPLFRIMIGVFGGAKIGVREYLRGVSKNLGVACKFE